MSVSEGVLERRSWDRLDKVAAQQPRPDIEKLERYRATFLQNFSPERLREMTPQELLVSLPYNEEGRSLPNGVLDYWLEVKSDPSFETQEFGGIGGGSAYKFGLFQHKETGEWRTGEVRASKADVLSEAQALEVITARRDAMVAVVDRLRTQRGRLQDVDALALEKELGSIGGFWYRKGWFHKYLHLCIPELVTWYHSTSFLEAALYRAGFPPVKNVYLPNDTEILKVFSDLPSLADMPPHYRYHQVPSRPGRDYFAFRLTQEMWAEWQRERAICLGPANIGDLARAYDQAGKTAIEQAVKKRIADAGDSGGSHEETLVRLHPGTMRPGHVVVALLDSSRVVGVGTLTDDNYHYVPGAEHPHRRLVRWAHFAEFELPKPLEKPFVFMTLNKTGLDIPAIEQSVLAFSKGPWPEFEEAEHEGGTINPLLPRILPPPEPRLVAETLRVVDRKLQVILYGPPGTGKTWLARRAALELVARRNFQALPGELTDAQAVEAEACTATCTFHPAYGYEDFIEGFRPLPGGGFEVRPGIFRQIVEKAAAHPDSTFVLVIDEINRGNIPQIFGELISLMERDKRGKMAALLPLSGTSFTVPSNLYLIGTMNTADRSILLLDTALRRRFGFLEVMPDPHVLRDSVIGDFRLSSWLESLNRRIVDQLKRDGRNLQVGHAYLMHDGSPVATTSRFAEVLSDEIFPLLQEYCYEDESALEAILQGGLYSRSSGDLNRGLFEPGSEERLLAAARRIILSDDLLDPLAEDVEAPEEAPSE